jgi:hypothetical protein
MQPLPDDNQIIFDKRYNVLYRIIMSYIAFRWCLKPIDFESFNEKYTIRWQNRVNDLRFLYRIQMIGL